MAGLSFGLYKLIGKHLGMGVLLITCPIFIVLAFLINVGDLWIALGIKLVGSAVLCVVSYKRSVDRKEMMAAALRERAELQVMRSQEEIKRYEEFLIDQRAKYEGNIKNVIEIFHGRNELILIYNWWHSGDERLWYPFTDHHFGGAFNEINDDLKFELFKKSLNENMGKIETAVIDMLLERNFLLAKVGLKLLQLAKHDINIAKIQDILYATDPASKTPTGLFASLQNIGLDENSEYYKNLQHLFFENVFSKTK